MRVLLTGATGFLGQHVLTRLRAEGHSVLASRLNEPRDEEDKKEDVTWLAGDLACIEPLKATIESFDPGALIHLAWQGIPDYSERVSYVNLVNSMRLIDFVIEETGCRKVIVAGSCLEYGRKTGECRESCCGTPGSYFAWAKEALCKYSALKCDRRAGLVWFRIFYVYGPGQRAAALIPMLVRSLEEGESPAIQAPLNRSDFVYVEDVARAFSLALTTEIESGIYNLGSGRSASVIDICKIVERRLIGECDFSESLARDNRRESEVDFWAATDKTQSALNWRSVTGLDEGIHKFLENG